MAEDIFVGEDQREDIFVGENQEGKEEEVHMGVLIQFFDTGLVLIVICTNTQNGIWDRFLNQIC